MKLIINGKEREVDVENIQQLLEQLELDPKKVVVELNRDIVDRAKYADTPLNEDDSLEIVTMVGGG